METYGPTPLSPDQKGVLERALGQHFYRQDLDALKATERGPKRLFDHVEGRYNLIATSVVPWLGRFVDLPRCNVVELGCGTGSSTAAFAEHCRRIDAFDIEGGSLEVARVRLDILNLANANIVACPPSDILNLATGRDGISTDVILLFAVLEHMTVAERIESLRRCWQCLEPGGVLLVADTPNRLTYYDYHTAWLPFFHLLPPDLGAEYYRFSQREDFKVRIQNATRQGKDAAIEAIVRDGLGVSYHELEIAIGQEVHDYVVADGFEPEIAAVSPETPEQSLLAEFIAARKIPIQRAFTRSILAFILRKPS